MDAPTSCRRRLFAAACTVLAATLTGCDALPLEPHASEPVMRAALIDVIDLTPPKADFPTPRPDTAQTEPKTPVAINVLANDADTVHSTLPSADSTTSSIELALPVFPTLVRFTQPANGSVTLGPGGTLVYTSTSLLFWGVDHFTYTVVNAKGLAASTTVTVHVSPKWEIIPRWPPPDSTGGGH